MDNITNASAAFKQVYAPNSEAYVKQQNLNAKFFKTIGVADEKPSPEGNLNAITLRGDETGGAINENGAFQTPGYRLTAKPKVSPKLMAYPGEISGSMIRLSQGEKQAFAKEAASTMDDRLSRAFRDLERQAWGPGTGQITLANGAGSGSTSLVVDDIIQFRSGMYIDVWTALGGTQEVSNIQIANINYSTKTLVLASAQTWSDNSIVSKSGAITSAVTSLATALELTGYQGIIDTTTYSTTFEGLSVSTYNEWQGQVVDASSTPVTQDFLSQLYNRILLVSGDTPDRLMSNQTQSRVFRNSELQKVHYLAQEVKAGTKKMGEVKTGMYWGDLEWEVYNTCPTNVVFMDKKDSIKRYEVGELALSDLPGYTMYQKNGSDAIGYYFVYQGNIGTWKRNCNGKGINLTELTF